jgi:lysophospholipase L1-like esterase
MNQSQFAPTALICAAALAAAAGLAVAPAPAQTPSAAAPTSSVAPSASSVAVAAAESHACRFDRIHDRLEYPLTRVARDFETDRAIKIVAIGSSSTAGAGASSPEASYPSQLEAELTQHFHWQDTTVLNRGVNGEEAPDMLARFDASVIAEKPDLVIWQTGTNSVLRNHPLDPRATVLHEGLARLKAIHTDVILVDPQYAPKVIAEPELDGMLAQIAATAKALSVDLFHRFALMRHWYQADHMPFETFVSPDGLHMNDWGYACFAERLGSAIEEAATRPPATASASLHRPMHN